MINISKILICYLTLFKLLQANEVMECITQRQSGFHFLGKDYYEIIKYLGLDRFTISISGNRKGIIENQNEIKGAIGEKIRANNDDAKMSKVLAKIKTDVDLNVNLNSLKIDKPNNKELIFSISFLTNNL